MAKDLIQVAMVQFIVDVAFQWCQCSVVKHEAVCIKRIGGKLDLDDVVVSVYPRAGMILRQMAKLVRRRKVELLGDTIH